MSLLLDRGHDVSIGVNRLRERKHARLEGLERPAHPHSRRDSEAAATCGRRWRVPCAGRSTSSAICIPRFADAPALRARMKRKVLPSWMAWLDRTPTLTRCASSRALHTDGCTRVERAIPVSRSVDAISSTRIDRTP